MYLGRSACLGDFHQAEVRNRIKSAWAAFNKYKVIFASKAYPLHLKAKLFQSVVSPTALYAAASWTLTSSLERDLLTTQRKMMRIMLGAGRRPDEDWVDFIKRTTHTSESLMLELGCESWVKSHRRKKWQFLRKMASTTEQKWAKRILLWKPFFRCCPERCVGHPYSRWGDRIDDLVGGDWLVHAADGEIWKLLEEQLVIM